MWISNDVIVSADEFQNNELYIVLQIFPPEDWYMHQPKEQ